VETEVLGPEVLRSSGWHDGLNARGDADLLKVWLKSRQDGASHRAVLSSHRARLRQQMAHTFRRPSFAGQDRSEWRHIRQGWKWPTPDIWRNKFHRHRQRINLTPWAQSHRGSISG